MSNRAIYPLSNRAPKTMENLWETITFISGMGNGSTYPLHSAKTDAVKTTSNLQNGYYPVVADVDLHGYTQEEAQQVLNEFIAFVQRRGVCGEIIHGSGLGSSGYQPKLKNLVRRWLMMHPDVLAYAEPHKNNDGAVLILLKRQRKTDESTD